MINTIHEVITAYTKALASLNVTLYKGFKPLTEDGECIVIGYMPIYKNNVNSINDVVIFLYVKKLNGEMDSIRISTLCGLVSGKVDTLVATKGVILCTEESEPETSNMDENYTVTMIKYKTINS